MTTQTVSAGNGATPATGGGISNTARDLADDVRNTVQDVSAATKAGARHAADQTHASASEIARDIEALMLKIGPAASSEVRDLLATLKDRANSLGHSMQDVSIKAREQAAHGAEKARDVVRERPLQSVIAALLAGAAIGMLLSRRSGDE